MLTDESEGVPLPCLAALGLLGCAEPLCLGGTSPSRHPGSPTHSQPFRPARVSFTLARAEGASGSDTDETAPPQPRLVPAVAMGDLSVDPVTFWERLSKLHKMWNVRPAERGNCGHMRK